MRIHEEKSLSFVSFKKDDFLRSLLIGCGKKVPSLPNGVKFTFERKQHGRGIRTLAAHLNC